MTRIINWGVLSTARIGRNVVIPAIQANATSRLAGIASRDPARAEALADAVGGGVKAYGSYEALLDDPDIDAIYNPLPNHLHVPLTIEAARRGKHVLCEKPIACNRAEAEPLLTELPPGIHVMEAFMIRFHPQWQRARRLVEEGRLGDLRMVQVAFCYMNRDAGNIRNMADIGGGGLLDIGCYAVMSGRLLYGVEPRRVACLIDRDPEFGTDRVASGLLDFGEGRQLALTVSTQGTPHQRVLAIGTEAKLEILIPFNAPPAGTAIVLTPRGGEAETIDLGPVNQYERQVEAFNQAIRGEATLPAGPADALVNMAILDALFAADRAGGWVEIDYRGLPARR